MYKNHIYNIILILYLLCITAVIIYNIVKYKKKLKFEPSYSVIFGAVMLIPFAWMFVVKEHSYVHAFMTHKNLTVTVFAFLCLLNSLLLSPENNSDK